jgi:hypothetical protein
VAKLDDLKRFSENFRLGTRMSGEVPEGVGKKDERRDEEPDGA